MPSFIVSRLDRMLLIFFEKILFQVLLIFYYDEAANPVLFTHCFTNSICLSAKVLIVF